MIEKSPASQFDPRDFLSSEAVCVMSTTARGLYITLIPPQRSPEGCD